MFDNVIRPTKTTLLYVSWCCHFLVPVLPRQGSQKKNNPQPTQNAPPSNLLITSVLPQEHTSQALPPSHGHNDRDESPTECDLRHQRFQSPPRVIFNKTSKSKHSHTKRNRDVCPAQWVRTIRSLTQVRGLTRPSIPPPFH